MEEISKFAGAIEWQEGQWEAIFWKKNLSDKQQEWTQSVESSEHTSEELLKTDMK